MIEIELSRTGVPVVKLDGRWLASSFDPVKEARSWTMRAREAVQNFGQNIETVFVLGIGSGYHVLELRQAFPSVNLVVIDPNAENVQAVLQLHPQLNPHDILVLSSLEDLRESLEFQAALKSIYIVLPYAPTCQLAPEWHARVKTFMLGRDRVSFLQQVRTRPELHSLFSPEAIHAIGDEPVSIRTIRRLIPQSGSQNVERRLWRILEELIV